MSLGNLVGSIDEGTSSARFIIFRAGTNEIVCYHQIEVKSIHPQEGWCEQEPMHLIDVVNKCIEEAVKKLEQLGGKVEDIIAIGVTTQRETVVVWERETGLPIGNAIVWLDNRTSATVEELLKKIPLESRNIDYLRPLCGLPLSPYFTAVKLRWLRDNVPAVREAMDANTMVAGTVDSWLIYNLTGKQQHKTDVTNASRTMLMNIETLRYDQKLLDFFGLPENILPEICSSAEDFGEIADGPLKGIRITACLGDQQAALVGQQCLDKGQAKATFGTGCFLLYNIGTTIVHSTHGLLTTVGYQFGRETPPNYALEGSVSIAGVAFHWLRDNLGLFENFSQIETMALQVNDSLDVYFVPAFSGLFAPYWDHNARGIMCGLSEETTSEHLVRATHESICFQVRDILESMRKDCSTPLQKLMVDGGMTVNKLFLQLLSDLVGIQVVPAKIPETTALGAALAAYKVVNPDFDIAEPISGDANRIVYTAQETEKKRNDRYAKWQMAVERSLNWDSPVVIGSDSERELFDY